MKVDHKVKTIFGNGSVCRSADLQVGILKAVPG